MSTNLHLATKGSCKVCKHTGLKGCRMELWQTPTQVTWDSKPDLNNREFTFSVYTEWLMTRWPGDKDQAVLVEEHLQEVRKYLDAHPRAMFLAY